MNISIARSLLLCTFLSLSQKLISASDGESSLDPSKLVIKFKGSSDSSSLQEDSSSYDITKHESAHEYRFKSGTIPALVEYDSAEVWKLDDGSQAPSALYLLLNESAIVVVIDNNWKFFSNQGSGWQKEDLSLDPIEVDVNSKNSGDKYSYSTHEDTQIYMTRSPTYFKTVRAGEKTLFDTDSSIEFVRRIVLKESPSGDKTVTLHMLCGDEKVINLTPGGKPEIVSQSGSSHLGGSGRKLDTFKIVLIAGAVAGVLLIVCLVVCCLK